MGKRDFKTEGRRTGGRVRLNEGGGGRKSEYVWMEQRLFCVESFFMPDFKGKHISRSTYSYMCLIFRKLFCD